jgi:hypothetical protein
MKLRLAIVQRDGVQMGLAVEEEKILSDPSERESRLRFYETRIFRDLPVALVGEDFLKSPQFYARGEWAEMLDGVELEGIEWTTVDLPESSAE